MPRLGTAHRHSRIGPVRAAAWLIAALVSAGCGMPRDASGTLAHVRGGVIRVGLVANQPWVIDRGDTVAGIEGELVSTVARSVGARIEWVRMAEFDLIRALQRRELQIVIGGFDDGVSWGRTVALTRPYLESPEGKAHVLALPPGENAWLMLVDRQVEAFKAAVPARLARTPP